MRRANGLGPKTVVLGWKREPSGPAVRFGHW